MSIDGSENGMTPTVLIMDDCFSITAFHTPFHCGWEWHLKRNSRACLLIYSLASRVASKQGGVFWPSAARIALQFGLSKDTVHRALRALRKLGFFEWLGRGQRGTNRYRVLSHDDWKKKHPKQCAVYHRDLETDCIEPSPAIVPPRERNEFASGDQTMQTKAQDAKDEANANPTAGPRTASEGTRQSRAKEQRARNTSSDLATQHEIASLIRELTYLSGDKVTFQGRHKTALAELLKEYTVEELKVTFTTFLEDKDLDDHYTMKFIAQNYLDAADGLAYSARKRKRESLLAHLLIQE